jgi:zinc protease
MTNKVANLKSQTRGSRSAGGRAGLISLALLALSLPAFGAGLQVKDTVLGNGLKVVVYENHSAPVVNAEVWYRVGAYDEQSGYTGISHLLEHSMFNGTRLYPKGRYDGLIESFGGENNAFTSDFYTVYWADLSADHYDLELKLEADRMQNLLLDSAELERERNVVMEEWRLDDNDPDNVLWENFFATAFLTTPSHNPVIGWSDDIGRLHRSEVFAHYQKYYSPSNAVLCVVGDVQTSKVFAQAAGYFGSIKSHPVTRWHPVEPPQNGERTITVKRDVSTPDVMVGWHVPGVADPDFYTFEVLQALLARGVTSRLYNRLVYSSQEALSVYASNETEVDPGEFCVLAVPHSEEAIDTVLQTVYAEVESLKTRAVTDSELTRVKNQVIADFTFGQDDNGGLAYQIARSYLLFGSVDYANRYPARISAVTAQDIMRAAQKYLTEDNRTVGRLLPRPAETSGEEK